MIIDIKMTLRIKTTHILKINTRMKSKIRIKVVMVNMKGIHNKISNK